MPSAAAERVLTTPVVAPRPRFPYRADLDGLRGLAVLAVVIYHLCPPWLPGGFVGVDMFFVLSGYVVTGVLLAGQPAPPLPTLLGFYARRLKRLLPNLLLCLVSTALAFALLVPPSDQTNRIFRTGLRALFGWSNVYLNGKETGYFDVDTSLNPFTHTWSLGVEEQFYLVFPLLLLLGLALGRGRRRGAVLTVLAASVASLLHAIGLMKVGSSQSAFYLMAPRFWELAIGGLLALGLQGLPPLPPRLARGLRLVSMALLLTSVALISTGLPFPLPVVSLPVLASLLFITAGHGRGDRFLPWPPVERVLLALGLLSYSLYLWHWPVFVFFRLTLGLNTPLLRLLASLLALGLAVAAWALVERPLRRHKASSAAVFATAAVGLAAAWGAVDALAFPIGRVFLGNRDVRVPRSERYETDTVLDPSGPITPRRCRGINDDDASRAERCHRPAAAGRSTLMLLGDSHGLQYAPMVSAVARQGDLGFRLAWKPGCLVLPGLQAIPDIPGYKPCTPFVQNELAAAERQLQPGDVLVLSSFLQLYLFPMDQTLFEEAIHPRLMAAGRHLPAAAGRQRFQEEVRGLIRRFGDRGVRVVLIQDLPVLTGRTFTCEGAQALPFASLISSGCVPPPAVTATQRRQMLDLLAATVAGTDAVVFDPADPFLDASGRLRYRDEQGRYTFVDDDHITISASRDLAPRFASFLRQHGLATTAAPHGG